MLPLNLLTFPRGAGYQLDLKRNKSLKLELPEGVKLEEHSERNDRTASRDSREKALAAPANCHGG